MLLWYLAPSSRSTLALLVIHLHEQVQWLGLLRVVEEAARVHLALDGGVPVILHSIVGPAKQVAEKKTPSGTALKHS